MLARSVSHLRLSPRLSYAASIAIALTLFEGMQSLINAASLPLEVVVARMINAALVRGWRDVMLIPEPGPQLGIFVAYALMGLVLIAIGLSLGIGILSHGGREK